MDILHRINCHLAVRRKQATIHRALAQQDPRGLADLGLEPADIAAVARVGSRLGPDGANLSEIVARVRAARTKSVSPADRLFASLQRMSERKAAASSYTPADLDRYIEEAHRLRAETLAGYGRAVRKELADLFRPAVQAALDSGLGRRIQLQLVWHRAYRQVRAELESYSDRELKTDLRLARSEIGDTAAESANERVGDYVAANPSLRRELAGRRALHRAHG